MPSADAGSSTDFPNFFGVAPHAQHALDLFKGEWSTRLPDNLGLVASTGPGRFCEDYRVTWVEQQINGFAGKTVIELGPMEGGHATMLEKMGAKEITAIEANSRAYLKCLVMKEIFGLTRTRFLLGDFLPYFQATSTTYDVGFACGVIYHSTNPVELIEQLARHCRTVFVWTHVHDPAFLAQNPEIGALFQPGRPATVGGFAHTLYRKGYGAAPQWKGFCGGGVEASWLSAADLLGAFGHFGFKIKELITQEHPGSPALLFVAERTPQS